MILNKRQKKLLKKLAKKHLTEKQYQAPKIPGLLIHREGGEAYESEIHRFLLIAQDDKEALEKLEDYYPVYGLSFNSPYDCTGRPFCDPADVKRVAADRYLVTLNIRYDV